MLFLIIGVCKKLHDSYYDNEYDEKTKFLFGSYKTKTNVRPLSEDQDVDVLFKIPEEIFIKVKAYKNNGQMDSLPFYKKLKVSLMKSTPLLM